MAFMSPLTQQIPSSSGNSGSAFSYRKDRMINTDSTDVMYSGKYASHRLASESVYTLGMQKDSFMYENSCLNGVVANTIQRTDLKNPQKKPLITVTDLLYTNFESDGTITTEPPFGIFSRNSSSSDVQENVVHGLEKLINSFKSLEYGWDGSFAKLIPETVINNSQKILLALHSKLPEVYPTGRESIQFEYDKDEKSLEIEIFNDRFEIALFDQANLVEEKSFSLSQIHVIDEFLAKLYEL